MVNNTYPDKFKDNFNEKLNISCLQKCLLHHKLSDQELILQMPHPDQAGALQ